MILQINTQPNLLLEAARLVCACVNGIEPQYLTAEEPSCIPVTEVAKMMETVCVDLDLNSSRVKFYFHCDISLKRCWFGIEIHMHMKEHIKRLTPSICTQIVQKRLKTR